MTGCIGLCESDALCGELIDMGSFVKRASVATQIAPSEVVDQEEDDVWAACFGRPECCQQQQQGQGSQAARGAGLSHSGVLSLTELIDRCRTDLTDR